jgi:hypothetical protein
MDFGDFKAAWTFSGQEAISLQTGILLNLPQTWQISRRKFSRLIIEVGQQHFTLATVDMQRGIRKIPSLREILPVE